MGTLFVVPTPVGNMEDFTFRAINTLKSVDLILAEDTRTSSVLLKHYDIHKELLSHHKFNEHQTTDSVVNRIKAGENVALISDAGTPAISDPGFLLVRECVRNEIEVITLPGPTAFVPAIVSSGLPVDKFCFEGFLPQKKGRQSRLETLKDEERTSVSREISKIHEETVRGTLQELVQHFTETEPRGEIVIVVAGNQNAEKPVKEINKSKNKYKKENLDED